jgi:cytidylate kinase
MPLSTTRTLDPVPRHGDRGESAPAAARFPRTLTVAVSRQSGARGGSVAARVGRKLGWQVVDQELLEYIANQEAGADAGVPEQAKAWAEARIHELREQGRLSGDPQVMAMARVILALGAVGEVIVVGRGAGHVLPPASTLHVRLVAPRADRVAYLGQLLRFTPEEAEREVDARDGRRKQFLLDHLSVDPNDPAGYHLVLNSALLGEEVCAELIVQAARLKLMGADPAAPPENGPDVAS